MVQLKRKEERKVCEKGQYWHHHGRKLPTAPPTFRFHEGFHQAGSFRRPHATQRNQRIGSGKKVKRYVLTLTRIVVQYHLYILYRYGEKRVDDRPTASSRNQSDGGT